MRPLLTIAFATTLAAAPAFKVQELQNNWGVVYAVLIEDVNRDGKPDVVAISPTQLAWWENGANWKRHVVMDGLTKKDNVCFAAEDLDGDGHLDFTIGADWQPSNTKSAGTLHFPLAIRARP